MKKKHAFLIGFVIFTMGIGFLAYWLVTGRQPGRANPLSGEVIVRMKEDSFTPSLLYIRAGTTVRFINEDTSSHWPASDLHPSHTLYSEFDPKAAIGPQEEWSFSFTKVGEWGMHDHLAPFIEGKIVVVP